MPVVWEDTRIEAVRALLERSFQMGDVYNVLQDADRLTSGDRAQDYGSAKDDLGRTAAMWSQILGTEVNPMGVALCMIALKISRQCNKLKRDNLVDIAGYARVAEMLGEE